VKTLLQIFLICFAGSIFAQELPLPARPTNAPDGDAFVQKISSMDLAQRDETTAREFLAGNAPGFLRKFCPVNVTNVADGKTNVATFFATPDYLAIGSDENYFFAPVSPATAQQIADQLDCILPTRRMVDAIYATAAVKLVPSPIPPSAAMTTVPIFAEHNFIVRAQRMAWTNEYPLGALTAGHKKDVVITARLAAVTNKVAIYGWHHTNGVAIQPLYLGHVVWWVDYSQCIRLVSRTMLVNGEKKSINEVLADPQLCGLLSDEGVITNARYPTNLMMPPLITEKINLPWPEKFSVTTNYDEWVREIKLPEDVLIVINAPDKEKFSQDKPVMLIFYALPNGNTIEQTAGKKIQPGEDWHYDIQHIAAQTRWLRNVITNKTLVVAYLEAGGKSWPAWRKIHGDQKIPDMLDGVRGIFFSNRVEVVLAGHSGGGSLIFGWLNASEKIPDDVERIAFLDSNYAYNPTNHADKIKSWLAASPNHHLCVLAYQDYLAVLNGKTFVSENGGTWGRSRAMLEDLKTQFDFTSITNGALEKYSANNGQVEFLLMENPEKKIFHTVQVERNGFIEAMLSGTAYAGKGYEYFGGRAYTNWISPAGF
jgi:hypothetical protein